MSRFWSASLLVLAACGGSLETKICSRLDECNALNGTSVDECADTWSSDLDDMSDSVRADCESQIKDCLDNESCDNFLSCSISDCDFGTTSYYTYGGAGPAGRAGRSYRSRSAVNRTASAHAMPIRSR